MIDDWLLVVNTHKVNARGVLLLKILQPKMCNEDEYRKLPPNQVYLPVPAVAGAAEKIQREGGENALSMSRIFSWLLPLPSFH